MTETQKLLRDIESFTAKHGMKETTFGRLAVNDGKLVGRLRAGGSITIRTLEDVRAFLASRRSSSDADCEASP